MTSSQPPQPPPPASPYAQVGGSGISFDPKKLRMADYVVAAGTVLYLVAAILPWVDFGDYFGVDVPGDSLSGFRYSGLVSGAFVLFLLAAAWALLPAFTDLKLGFPRGWITVGLTALGFLLTLFAWISTLQYGFQIGPLLGLLVAAAITLFAVLALLPELRNRPALPGGLANAAQWANQPAPQFGQHGEPGPGSVPPPVTGTYGQPTAQGPYAPPPVPPAPPAPPAPGTGTPPPPPPAG